MQDQPSPLPGPPVTPVGDDDVDILAVIERAAQSIGSIGDAPTEDQAERYQALHSVLQGALSDTDLRDSG